MLILAKARAETSETLEDSLVWRRALCGSEVTLRSMTSAGAMCGWRCVDLRLALRSRVAPKRQVLEAGDQFVGRATSAAMRHRSVRRVHHEDAREDLLARARPVFIESAILVSCAEGREHEG
mmetsp:Transcript_5687/g.16750  ORF Transcript_5687/g.16750 Transcript_5687/m.16750 type:complete len:122 (+) Transcript_5687:452-817(+)